MIKMQIELISSTELLKAEDMKRHVCAKFYRICAKFRLLCAKLVKQALVFMFLTQSDKV